jgi:hypothetical protein
MTPRSFPFRTLVVACATLVSLGTAACGSTEPELPAPSLDGVWQSTAADGERTIRLGADGAASDVNARFDLRECTTSGGSWSADGSTLVLTLAEAGGGSREERFTYQVFDDRLILGSETYRGVSALPDCGSYDFGTWTGTLTAAVDSVPQTFANISVTTALSSGLLEIRACPEAGGSCSVSDAELILKIDAPPGPLTPGTYPIQNNAIGQPNFFALIDTHPDDSTFPGFNTERREPPGVFVLASVSDSTVVGTFEFRANEISEGLSAPDGRTFVLVTSGVVDLVYR